MNQWILLDNSGGYVNMNYVISIHPVNTSGTWHLWANVNGTNNRLPGTYANEADALEAARKFTHGIDLRDAIS